MSRLCPRTRRKGVALQEALVSLLVAAAVLVGVVQLLAVIARQQRACQERTWATREVGNVMERLMARPWEALTEEKLEECEISAAAREALPGAELQIQVAEDGEGENRRRIIVQIGWPKDGPVEKDPVRLVAWRSRGQEEQP